MPPRTERQIMRLQDDLRALEVRIETLERDRDTWTPAPKYTRANKGIRIYAHPVRDEGELITITSMDSSPAGDLVLVQLPDNCSVDGHMSVMRERLLEAIGIARRVLDNETDSEYRDAAYDRIEELETEGNKHAP